MRQTFCLGCLLLSIGAFAADGWQPLFNGKDFAGWQTYLSAPEAGWQVSGLKRATNGNYLEPVGLNHDPLKVFTVGTVDGRPAIHISGQGYGTLTTTANFTNFHLRLQMKWGEKRWGKRATAPRDSGLLYFGHGTPGAMSGNWPRSIEFQIQEHDIGDLYPVGARITVKAVQLTTNSWAYDPEGAPRVFEKNRRCIKHGDAEKPNGEWNTLELICLNGDSMHIVNGRVMMRLTHAERVDGKNPEPLTSGHLSLQTEGAEVFYRDIEIQPILEMPRAFLE